MAGASFEKLLSATGEVPKRGRPKDQHGPEAGLAGASDDFPAHSSMVVNNFPTNTFAPSG
jgi:hypothetical protein